VLVSEPGKGMIQSAGHIPFFLGTGDIFHLEFKTDRKSKKTEYELWTKQWLAGWPKS
jgi:hypothetical protein